MAMVIITIQDMPDGTVDVRMNSEPIVQPGQTEFTQAQRMGAVSLNAIKGALDEESERPRLVLVGADEMPPH